MAANLNEYLTTRELADLLRIKERKVYDLVSNGDVPCSRATGKLLFPLKEVEAWLQANASGGSREAESPRPNVVVGSHDPLLEWALRESRCGLASYFDSSIDGLNRFEARDGVATGLHIYDSDTGQWNVPTIESRFSVERVVLVEWAKRKRGIIVRPELINSIKSLGDLIGKRVVPRQAEAGSQVLFDALLKRETINPSDIDWSSPIRSEVDAVLAVSEQKADATFGLAALAAQHRLQFVPILDERFDLLVERRAWFDVTWQALVSFCHSPAFQQRASELIGYDTSTQFTVHFNSPL